jgi:tetratricopeptide (TPR) repeat protein
MRRNRLEPPYGEIADLLQDGQVIPFLGAGVNFGMRPAGASWNEKSEGFLPNGGELSQFLARQINFPADEENDTKDLAKVASYFVEASARRRLREHLRRIFDREFAPCEVHKYLASITAPMLIVTTNYDTLVEQAFGQAGRAYDLVIHPTDRKDVEASVLWWKHGDAEPTAVPPNQLFIDLKTTTVIYNLIRDGQLAITGKKYDRAVEKLNQAIQMDAGNSRALMFKGYAQWLNGDAAAAAQSLEQSVKISPNYPFGHCYLALAYWDTGQPERALAAVKTTLELEKAQGGTRFRDLFKDNADFRRIRNSPEHGEAFLKLLE